MRKVDSRKARVHDQLEIRHLVDVMTKTVPPLIHALRAIGHGHRAFFPWLQRDGLDETAIADRQIGDGLTANAQGESVVHGARRGQFQIEVHGPALVRGVGDGVRGIELDLIDRVPQQALAPMLHRQIDFNAAGPQVQVASFLHHARGGFAHGAGLDTHGTGLGMGHALQPIDLRRLLRLRHTPKLTHSTFELVVLRLRAKLNSRAQNEPSDRDAEVNDADGDNALDHGIPPMVKKNFDRRRNGHEPAFSIRSRTRSGNWHDSHRPSEHHAYPASCDAEGDT